MRIDIRFAHKMPSSVRVDLAEDFVPGTSIPVDGGVHDLRMGTMLGHECKTCSTAGFLCPGHWGHIQLTEPALWPHQMPDLMKILNGSCLWDQSLKLTPTEKFVAINSLKLLEFHCIADAEELWNNTLRFALTNTPAFLVQKYGDVEKLFESWVEAGSGKAKKPLKSKAEQQEEDDMSDDDEEDNKKSGSGAAIGDSASSASSTSSEIREQQFKFLSDKINNIINLKAKSMNMEPEKLKYECQSNPTSSFQVTRKKFISEIISTMSGRHICPFDMYKCRNPRFTMDRQHGNKLIFHERGCDPTSHSQTEYSNRVPFLTNIVENDALNDITPEHVALAAPVWNFLTTVYRNDKELLDAIYRTTKVSEFLAIFVTKRIMIPPNMMRPPELRSSTEPFTSGTYSMYIKRIVAQNNLIKELKPQVKDHDSKIKYISALQHIQNLLNGLINGDTHSNWKGIREEIARKEGIFRKYFMGKRVNFSARSVITPSLTCNAKEIQIPLVVAMKLSYPAWVTDFNVDLLKKCIRNGPEEYPGCNSVDLISGGTIKMHQLSEADRISLSNQIIHKVRVVHRHIMDGDYCLFNRQPTLHRPSLMSHRVRVSPIKDEKVIRFHYANCKSYNADFDGDEMNIHFPRNELSRAEMQFVSHAPLQYIDPTRAEPIRGLIQDHIASGVLLSMKNTFLEREEYFQLIHEALYRFIPEDESVSPLQPCILKPKHLWSGKQVFSTIIINLIRFYNREHSLNYDGKSKLKGDVWAPFEEEGKVIIRGGELLTGIMDKAQIGAAKKSMVHALYEINGPHFTDDLISALSRVLTMYLKSHGFTCSIEDCLLNELGDNIRKKIMKQNVRQTIADSTNFITEGRSTSRSEKFKQVQELYKDQSRVKDFDNVVKKVVNKNTETLANRTVPKQQFRQFPYNFLSLMAESGAKGSRVNVSQIACCLGLQTYSGQRVAPNVSGQTLPSFDNFDLRPMAGAYIGGRFLTGLQPQEFFFHCMAGREGLNDTALKTADSGYLQRCLIKALEDITISYDHTVRDGHGSVIQFVYGGDGTDPSKLSYDDMTFMALNADALLEKFHRVLGLDAKNRGDAKAMAQEATSYMSRFMTADKNRNELENGVVKHLDNEIENYIRSDPDNVLRGDETSTQRDLSDTLRHLKKLHHVDSIFAPGEAVGILAAQAVGEPSTQMTLNTFHQTGSDVVGVTQGIPRLRQLLMSGNVKETVMSIPFKEGVSPEEAFKLEVLLNPLSFKRILKSQKMVERFQDAQILVHLDFEFDVDVLENEFYFPMRYFKQRVQTLIEEICIGAKGLSVARKRTFTRQLARLQYEDMVQIVRQGLSQHKLCSVDNDWDEKIKLLTTDAMESLNKDYLDEKFGQEHGALLLNHRKNALEKISTRLRNDKIHVDEFRTQRKEMVKKLVDGVPDISIENGTLSMVLKIPLAEKETLSQIVSDALDTTFVRFVPDIKMAQFVENDNKLLLQGLDRNFISRYRLESVLDETRLSMNNIREMLDQLGIEAGRNLLFSELDLVFSSYGQDVNKRHLSLISDWTTYLGEYLTMSKYGYKYHPSTFSRSTFETAANVMTEAATYGYVDPLRTPSSQLILGKRTGTGTGAFDVVSDVKFTSSFARKGFHSIVM